MTLQWVLLIIQLSKHKEIWKVFFENHLTFVRLKPMRNIFNGKFIPGAIFSGDI